MVGGGGGGYPLEHKTDGEVPMTGLFYRERSWRVYDLKSILGPRNFRKSLTGLKNSANSVIGFGFFLMGIF